jgi:hypothetical protein
MVLLQKKQAVSQAKGRSTGPSLFGEAEDPTIEPAVFTDTPDAHRDGELGDTIMSRRHETDAISIGIDHGAWCPDARSCNAQLAIAAGRSGRQRFDVMIEFYQRAQRVVPVLFLAAANRQDMIEAKADIVQPEPQHWFQIVRRKSDVNDVFCELHLPHHNRTTYRKRLGDVPRPAGQSNRNRLDRRQRVGRVAKGLGRGPEGAKKTAPHSLTIAKSRLASNFLDWQPPLLEHEPGGLEAQVFNCLCR